MEVCSEAFAEVRSASSSVGSKCLENLPVRVPVRRELDLVCSASRGNFVQTTGHCLNVDSVENKLPAAAHEPLCYQKRLVIPLQLCLNVVLQAINPYGFVRPGHAI